VAKVLPRGAVQLSPEVMERLGLKPGTKLILATTGDVVVMRRAEGLLNRPLPIPLGITDGQPICWP
jgi:formylmethanofuran dehydrogenase subunit D